MAAEKQFIPLNVAILTISDTRDESTDSSGHYLAEVAESTGHQLADKKIVKDDVYQIRAIISQWIADDRVNAIITTGGTGFSGRDSTPEAISPLLDKKIDGFGELFRHVSWQEIGVSTIQSRCLAGLANKTVVFCLPGSSGACKTGWSLIECQLDARHKPCNFVPQLNLSAEQCATRDA